MTPDMFRNVRIKITSVPIPYSSELSVTMARGKPHQLVVQGFGCSQCSHANPNPHSTRKSRKLSPQQDEAIVSLFRRLQINLMGLKIRKRNK